MKKQNSLEKMVLGNRDNKLLFIVLLSIAYLFFVYFLGKISGEYLYHFIN